MKKSLNASLRKHVELLRGRRSEYLLPVFLPGEESSGHEEAVQTPEVQPSEGGEAREEAQQRGLCDAAPRQGQALQPGPQAQTHLKRGTPQAQVEGLKIETRMRKRVEQLRAAKVNTATATWWRGHNTIALWLQANLLQP